MCRDGGFTSLVLPSIAVNSYLHMVVHRSAAMRRAGLVFRLVTFYFSHSEHQKYFISFAETYGMKYRILRLCNVLGAGDQKASKKKRTVHKYWKLPPSQLKLQTTFTLPIYRNLKKW